MKIEWLRDCVNLAKTLNFTNAAELSSIAQSALSKHIKSAERELGVPLFTRTKRSVTLTEAGAVFIEGAARVVAEYEHTTERLLGWQAGSKGVLRIGYLQGFIAPDLSRIQSLFSYEYPELEVQYSTYEFNDITNALENNEIDLAASFIPEALKDASHSWVVSLEDHYCVVVDSRDPLSEKSEVSIADLVGHTVALPASDFYTSDNADIIEFLNAEENDIVIRSEVRDINTLPILIQANDWIGVSFGHLRNYHKGELIFLPIRGFDKRTSYGAVWKTRSNDAPLRRWAEIAADVKNRQAT